MTCKWHFIDLPRAHSVKEPTESQFFKWDSTTPSKAVVREGIQNALDAKAAGREKVSVRIAVIYRPEIGDNSVLSSSDIHSHTYAENNGIHPDDRPPKSGNDFQFLVFEDFGTIGLTGDVHANTRVDRQENNFLNFFRFIGGTDKSEGDRGQWGIGKQTFWTASRISTVFGFTIREGESEMLFMGKTILKSHAITENGRNDYQDGFYGISEADGFVLPVSEEAEVRKFADMFSLKRKTEPGLSLVVPWLDKGIKYEDIQKSVIDDYFYPILAGQLEVELQRYDQTMFLNAENLEEEIQGIDKGRAAPLVDLSKRLLDISSSGKIITVNPYDSEKPMWEASIFSKEQLSKVSKDYRDGNPVFLRVTLNISPKIGRSIPSHFDIALVRNDDEIPQRPVFIRNGITIPDVDARKEKGVLALVVADDGALARFLGRSENPAHTHWQPPRLKNNYDNIPKVMDFVKGSVKNIINILVASNVEKDEEILAKLFPMEDSEIPGKPKPSKESTTPDPPGGPAVSNCRIRRIPGGFEVLPGNAEILLPSNLTVQFAYHVQRGNPLRKYALDDFDIKSSQFDITNKGLENVKKSENKILAEIIENNFSLRVIGFDINRDLYVKAVISDSEGKDT